MSLIRHAIYIILLIVISSLLVVDLFLNPGTPSTFDGNIHLSNIAQYAQSISDGALHVRFGNGFAKYGLPTPLFSQQTTNYIGAFIYFIFKDVVLTYKLIYLIGAISSTTMLYIFLQKDFGQFPAFISSVLFNYAPYRIINIYIRGALPEFFSSTFIIMGLIGIRRLKYSNKHKIVNFVYLTLSQSLLILCHPFVFIMSFLLYIPYLIYISNTKLVLVKNSLLFTIATVASIFLTSFYTIPLVFESQYFNYGRNINSLMGGQFLLLNNFVDPSWYYALSDSLISRGNFIKVDPFETSILLAAVLALLVWKVRKIKLPKISIIFAIIPILIFLLTPLSEFFYMNLKILNLLQFPWRFLSILIFIPPIIVSYALKNFKYRILIGLFLAGSLIMFRGAQVYGKNYTISKNYEYFHPQVNHYSNLLSPVWVGRIEEYPNKYYKGEAPGNDGEFIDRIEKNDYRSYTIQASDKILLVDNTFYYPGWKVYIDGIPTEIQFQHEKFRGMITYIMPRGIHNILVVFEQTKIRKIADLISSVTFFLFVVVGSLNIFKKKLNNI